MALRDPGKDEQISGYRGGNPKTPDPGARLYVDSFRDSPPFDRKCKAAAREAAAVAVAVADNEVFRLLGGLRQ